MSEVYHRHGAHDGPQKAAEGGRSTPSLLVDAGEDGPPTTGEADHAGEPRTPGAPETHRHASRRTPATG